MNLKDVKFHTELLINRSEKLLNSIVAGYYEENVEVQKLDKQQIFNDFDLVHKQCERLEKFIKRGEIMDVTTALKQIQLEKVKGELRALKASYYDPMDSDNDRYKEVNTLIEGVIHELDNELG